MNALTAARSNQPDYSPLPPIVNRLSVAILAAAMVAGIGLRVMHLRQLPPGLHPDEACNGYDAYSILKTGRDQHGNFLPLVIQGFDDYRMPLFDYSLVPLVGAFGLEPAAIRLGAALWGVADQAAIAAMAGLLLGWPGAAMAAVLVALSPWQLHISRLALETTTASATTDLAMLCFFLWLARRNSHWLMLSGLCFGLSLYSYSITKAFVPLMIGWLTFCYWRDLARSARAAALAMALVVLLALPQGALLLRQTARMQARFEEISVFSSEGSMRDRIDQFGSAFAGYFGPSFLFLQGDSNPTLHPPGLGQLLPEQALLIALGLTALIGSRRRKLALVLLGWIVLGMLPAAMLVPSPHALHSILAFAPLTLLSALGFAALLEFDFRSRLVKLGAAAVIVIATIASGSWFVRVYFRDYPVLEESDFRYGLDQVVRDSEKFGDGPRVFLTDLGTGYIFVLFFRPYPPELFQHTRVVREDGLFGKVFGFDRYLFPSFNPQSLYASIEHGVFVFGGDHPPPAPPAETIHYLDGSVAYYIVVK